MTYGHALALNQDGANAYLTLACNADAQHYPARTRYSPGPVARYHRSMMLVDRDGIVRTPLEAPFLEIGS
jgi:hypothetical protein